MKQEEKIKGWIARDSYPEKLHFFERKPRKDGLCWNYGYRRIELPTELFPEIKWSSEPIEVELIIKNVI